MKNSSHADSSDLEQKYKNMTIDLYKVFAKYVVAGAITIIAIEACLSLLNQNYKQTIIHICLISTIGVYLRWLLTRKGTNQMAIIIFYLLFYSSGLIIQYKKAERFTSVYEAFIFGYGYSISERLMVEHMPNINHRIFFNIFTLGLRMFMFPEAELITYVKQCMFLFLTILTGLERERHGKAFFFSYCNSREQLNKFKNLVEENIPEAIVIASQDLTKSFFVNNAFWNLVKGTEPSIKSQLKRFVLEDEIASTQNIETNTMNPPIGNTLLDFIGTSSFIDGESCIVTLHKKANNENTNDNRGPKGTRLLFEVKLSKIIWDEQPCISIILHDVTEHHTILSLKIADAQKDKVLATVSHELKTPLNGMLGMIQVMEKKIKDAELLRFLTICKSSTTLLVSLVCSILDLNQIRADKMKLNKENIEVKKLVKDVLSLFEYQCQQKGIYLTTRIEPGTPNLLYTDKDRLSQVLINLVGNAQKFTSRGGILVNISRGEEENSVRFSVEDTGIGISKQNQEKLFQVYGKLSQEDDRINRHGVGLGLTIAESLVRALNNNVKDTRAITIESEGGRGSTFSFTIRPVGRTETKYDSKYLLKPDSVLLPTIPDENEDSPKVTVLHRSLLREHFRWNNHSPSTQPSPALKRRKEDNSSSPCILLVDDNIFNIAVAEHLVLSHRYRVKTALSGLDAIDIVSKNNHATDQIILILMDCQMPIMDGYEATRVLKKMMQDKKVPTIPIIALTANDSDGDREICRKAGMCDHLSKPLKDGELERILKKYC